ncbi:unnamed protein product [Dracunculus medinensis]|uniref:CFEM domain-containing protein n=1 Tax=Dracunculus medinensis TaxID=318479 RepID=A0A0N4UK79_DRAME|nr:unnamed protein product [Dracunculus medinensis]
MKNILSTGRKFFKCVQQCTTKTSCVSKLKCGLDLPSDTVLVQTGKQCAISSGVNTAVVQQMCNCAVNAGIRQLQSVCPRLIVS